MLVGPSKIDCKTVRIFASVFKYARAVKQKGSLERGYGRVRLASFARVRHIRHALPISLLILRKTPTVLQSTEQMIETNNSNQT